MTSLLLTVKRILTFLFGTLHVKDDFRDENGKILVGKIMYKFWYFMNLQKAWPFKPNKLSSYCATSLQTAIELGIYIQIISVFHNLDSFDNFVSSYTICSILVQTNLRAVSLRLNEEKAIQINDLLESEEMQPKNERQCEMFLVMLHRCNLMYNIYIKVFCLALIGMTISGKYVDDIYLPCDEVYRNIGANILLYTNMYRHTSADLGFCSISLIITAQCNCLSDMLEHLEKNASLKCKCTGNNQKDEECFQLECEESFKRCIKKHQSILK